MKQVEKPDDVLIQTGPKEYMALQTLYSNTAGTIKYEKLVDQMKKFDGPLYQAVKMYHHLHGLYQR